MIKQPKIILDSDVYEAARKKWGDQNQIDVAIEEMSELIHAIIRHRRGTLSAEFVCEEIADVRICMDQLVEIYGSKSCREWRDKKMKRLHLRTLEGEPRTISKEGGQKS